MENNSSKGLSIAGLVLGIVACAIPWWGLVCAIIGLVCGIVGLILSIKARKSNPTGLATAGLILGIIGIVLSIIGLIACGICAAAGAAATAGLEEAAQSGELENALESIANEIATTVAGN